MSKEIRLPIPLKFILICSLFVLAGISVIVFGMVNLTSNNKYLAGNNDYIIVFMGIILLIPGFFFSYKLLKAKFSDSNVKRRQILDEFPLEWSGVYWFYIKNTIFCLFVFYLYVIDFV